MAPTSTTLKPPSTWYNRLSNPVVQPVWQQAVSCKQTSNRLSVVKRVWQPVWQPCWTNSCSFNRLSNRGVQPVWQTWFDNCVERTATVRSTQLSKLSSQLRHMSTIGKKLIKQQYLPHMSLQYGELQPTSSWGLLASLGHPCKFQRVSRLSSITARHSSSGR